MMSGSRLQVRSLVAFGLVALLAGPALAADDAIRTQRVQFTKGASSAIVSGKIKGNQTVDYLVTARKGQVANVSLATRHGATYFNLLAPGQTEVGFFNGSVSQNQFEGALPADGEYRIRVYMMRSAARRNEVADYRLEIAIAAAGKAAAASSGGARASAAQRAGEGKFDASGRIPCAQAAGQPMTQQCDFGVARAAGGSAAVAVTLPDGRKRMLFFEGGKAVGADLSQADGDTSFQAAKESDLFLIRAGKERYEVPEAVVTGG